MTGLPEAVISAGSALPVVEIAILIAFGARFVAKAFNLLAVVERWPRRLTGLVFVGLGIYMTLIYTLEVQL